MERLMIEGYKINLSSEVKIQNTRYLFNYNDLSKTLFKSYFEKILLSLILNPYVLTFKQIRSNYQQQQNVD